MFATLDLTSGSPSRTDGNGAGSGGLPPARAKRSQVRRACDWCKLMRIKCDNDRPCYHCRQAHRECGMSRQNQFHSLAAAVKEVETLRAQLRGLENATKTPEAPKPGAVPSPKTHRDGPSPAPGASSADLTTGIVERPPLPGSNKSGASSLSNTSISTASSGNTTSSTSSTVATSVSATSNNRNPANAGPMVHGIASLPFFLFRMLHYLQRTRSQLDLDMEIIACSSGNLSPPSLDLNSSSTNFLPPEHEVQALTLFWQSHYFSFPILNEGNFRREYKALLAETRPGAPRKASPLVDIVLALCIQLASFVTRASDSPEAPGTYPNLAGFQYYRRCQEALDHMIESPTIVTVQCYIFSIVYLYEAGFFNRAQLVASKAILTATMLGLSQEPQGGESEPEEEELARRTWWALYALDARISMETGRPPIIAAASLARHLPSDSIEFAQWLAPHYQHDPACPPWLGFQTQTLRLLQAVGAVRAAFGVRYNEVVGDAGYDALIANGAALEECARCLAGHMKHIEGWAKQVPKGYYVPRKEGQPFSTERSILDLSPNPNILIHCQRQRLLLELHYHQQCISLYQAFISFASPSDISTPIADGNAAAGLYHAIALTNMMHQALTTSEALSGVYHVFRWQKNALFTMIGYAYTFPLTHARSTIQRSLDMAIAVIDMYRPVLSEAASVSNTAQALINDLGSVFKSFHAGSSWLSTPSSSTPPPFSPSSSTPASATSATAAAAAGAMSMVAAQTPIDLTSPDALYPFHNKSFLASGDQQMAIATDILSAQPAMSDVNGLFDFSLDMNSLQMLDGKENNWDSMDMLWANMDLTDELDTANSWGALGDIIPRAGTA